MVQDYTKDSVPILSHTVLYGEYHMYYNSIPNFLPIFKPYCNKVQALITAPPHCPPPQKEVIWKCRG